MIIYIASFLFILWLLMLEYVSRIPKVSNLCNKYVLITGCDTGFGNSLAKQLDGKGIHVIAACLTEKAKCDLKTTLSQRSSAIIMDVTDHSSVCTALKAVKKLIPESEGLYGLVNNAGVMGYAGEMYWYTRDEYKKVLDVNLFGLIDVTKVFTPLLKQGKGRVINVSSICGRVAMPTAGYSISKFGVECFSDELRVQLKSFGISVSIIEPGFFKTAITDEKPIFRNLRAKWNELDPESRKEYGGDEKLEENIEKGKKILELMPSTSTYKVVNAMEHALIAKYPKKRYSVGNDAKLFYIPLSYVSPMITDKLLSSD